MGKLRGIVLSYVLTMSLIGFISRSYYEKPGITPEIEYREVHPRVKKEKVISYFDQNGNKKLDDIKERFEFSKERGLQRILGESEITFYDIVKVYDSLLKEGKIKE